MTDYHGLQSNDRCSDTNSNLGFGVSQNSSTQIFDNSCEDLTAICQSKTAVSYASLQVIKGPYAGESFLLNQNLISVGRDPSCSIFLNDMTVSREHCKFEMRDGYWHLTDCGSLNGTWVNGAIVSEADVYDGASIQIGTYVLTLHMNAS